MTSEWQCTDAAKRPHIVEHLNGSAADIVRFLKVSTPNATATDYLAAFDTAYGTTENGAGILDSMHSRRKEKPLLSFIVLTNFIRPFSKDEFKLQA